MLIRDVVPELWRKRLELIRSHRERGCGNFEDGCVCICPDHRCGLIDDPLDPTDYWCASCADTGLVRRHGVQAECPDCDRGKVRRAPSLPWGQFERYQLDRLTGKSPARDATRLWLDGGRRAKPFLFLGGGSGTGKTHSAIAAGFALVGEGLSCQLCTTPDLLLSLQSTFRDKSERSAEDVLAAAKTVDALILDDIGAENPTDWAESQIYALVNARYVKSALTIMTGNLAPGEAPSNRTWSRILGDLSVAVNTGIVDRRRHP